MSDGMCQRILVPTDLSDFAKAAVRWAAMLQKRFNSRVTLLYADEPYFPMDILMGSRGPTADAASYTQFIHRELASLVSSHFPQDSPVETLVVEDEPVRAVVDSAAKLDADLVVMATHGRRGWRRALLGSVTESVVHRTRCAVMSIPPEDVGHGEPEIRRILCPVNFLPIGREALEVAVDLAVAFGADLTVLHVADAIDEPFLSDVERSFAAWIEPALRHRCRYIQVVERGDAPRGVLEIAESERADLIVLGAQHRRFSDSTVVGTTTERVIRFSKRPVMTVIVPETAPPKRSAFEMTPKA